MQVLIFEANPINLATGLPVTVQICSANSPATMIVDGAQFFPAVVQYPNRSVSLGDNGFETKLSPIGFSVQANPAWAQYYWDGALGRAWIGDHTSGTIGSFEKIFEGLVGSLSHEGQICFLELMGNDARLNNFDLLSAAYAGTGGAEGPSSMLGTLKPWASGECLNIEPVLLSAQYQVYQYHGYGATQAVDAVYENALTLGAPAATYTTYAALIGATLADGTWAAAPQIGMFRLANEPSGKLTADVRGAKNGGGTYVSTISGIVQHLMAVAAVNGIYIDTSSIGAFTQSWNFYTDGQTKVGSVIREAFKQANGYIFPNEAGVFKAGKYLSTKTATTPLTTADLREGPLYVMDVEEQESSIAVHRVKIGHSRCYATHSASEISPAIAEIQDNITALEDAYADAAADVITAQAAADAANARLASQANDNVLDRVDKFDLITEYQAILAAQSGIDARATGYGITTEKTAYDNAITALTSYLTSLSPAYNNTSADTTIVGSTFRSKFADVYSTREAVLRAIEQIAGTKANWPDITGTGKPSDNAGTTLNLFQNGGATYAITGNSVERINSAGGWDYNVYSQESYIGSAVVSGTLTGPAHSRIGLTGAGGAGSYHNLDYSFYRDGTTTFRIIEATVDVGVTGTCADTDIFAVTYDGVYVRYYRNGTERRKVATSAGRRFFAAISMYNVGCIAKNIQFGPYNDNAWSTIAGEGKPSDNAGTTLNLWDSHGSVYSISGNTITKAGPDAWDYSVFSREFSVGSGFVSARFESPHQIMFGLTGNTPSGVVSYANLEYAFYRTSTPTTWQIYESGAGSISGTCNADSTFLIAYDGVNVKYYVDGTLVRTKAANAGWKCYAGVAAMHQGAKLSNLQFGPYNDNAWSTVGGAGKPANNATSNFTLYDYTGGLYLINGNRVEKIGSSAWDTCVFSRESFTSGCVATCRLPDAASTAAMFGLVETIGGSDFTELDYAWYNNYSGPNSGIYESGNGRGTFGGTFSTNDVFKIVYDDAEILYYKNDSLMRRVPVARGKKFYLGVIIYGNGSVLEGGLTFGPYSATADTYVSANKWTPIGTGSRIIGNTMTKISGSHGLNEGGAVGTPLKNTAYVSSGCLFDTNNAGGWITFLALDPNDATNYTTFGAGTFYAMYTAASPDRTLNIYRHNGSGFVNIFSAVLTGTGLTYSKTRFALCFNGRRVFAMVDGVIYGGDTSAFDAPSGTTFYPKVLDYFRSDMLGSVNGITDMRYGNWSDARVYLNDGYTIINQSAYNTSEGTAAAIVGQGALAIKNNVDLSTSDIVTRGSIPPMIADNYFSYTSNTSSITFTWPAMTIYRPDGTTLSVSAGSQAITSLGSNIVFKFYPYVVEGTSTVVFPSGGTGSYGSPAIAYNPPSTAAATAMYVQGRIPLGPMIAATTTAGSGGGSGGGSNCIHEDTMVGDVRAGDLRIGSVIDTPDGPTKVLDVKHYVNSSWVALSSDGLDLGCVTLDHIFYRAKDDSEVRARDVKLGDILKADGQHIEITGLTLVKDEALAVGILIDDPHLHYMGVRALLSHNGNPKP